ncbi:hypothetical protein LZ31DRAFT_245478 [Colletotrichum somersetense]|nr:hypothetical protein LZ31DRAFT_245478 [Colletotrichum somersetense]
MYPGLSGAICVRIHTMQVRNDGGRPGGGGLSSSTNKVLIIYTGAISMEFLLHCNNPADEDRCTTRPDARRASRQHYMGGWAGGATVSAYTTPRRVRTDTDTQHAIPTTRHEGATRYSMISEAEGEGVGSKVQIPKLLGCPQAPRRKQSLGPKPPDRGCTAFTWSSFLETPFSHPCMGR